MTRRLESLWTRARPSPRNLWFLLVGALLCMPGHICAQSDRELSLRGAWLHATSCLDSASTVALLDRARAANLNALYPLVFYWGATAFYESDLVPWYENIAPGFDPLGCMVREGHKRGIEIHAWFVNGSNRASSWVFDEHPEWRATNALGESIDWFDLCRPEVRKWQSDVMLEVLQNYDVDGVHFDYIRFPNRSVCYGPSCQARALDEVGVNVADLTYATLPAFGHFTGNPLAGPTTAQVLAFFDDDVPAVTMNDLGGSVVLFNWHAETNTPGAINTALGALLRGWRHSADQEVQVLDSDINAVRYTHRFYELARDWVTRLGYTPVKVSDSALLRLPPQSSVILPNHYMMTDEQARALETHVINGGNALFIDGPVFALGSSQAARRLLGFESAGRFFNGERLILPEYGLVSFIPTSLRQASIEDERLRHASWNAWRRDQIGQLVADVHRRVKEAKPDRYVTAAVFHTEAAADNVLQDWSRWIRSGTLDYAIPMSYVTDVEALREDFDWWREIDPGLTRIVPSLAVYKVGAELSPQGHADTISRHVEAAKEEGANGFVLFRLELLHDETARILGEGVFKTSSSPDQAVPGDFNADGSVGFRDFILFAIHYGTADGDTLYEPIYDLDSDGRIDFADFLLFARLY